MWARCQRSQQLCGHGFGVVNDFVDTHFSRISSRKEKARETVFACSYGAQVDSFKQKNGQRSLNTVPLILAGMKNEE